MRGDLSDGRSRPLATCQLDQLERLQSHGACSSVVGVVQHGLRQRLTNLLIYTIYRVAMLVTLLGIGVAWNGLRAIPLVAEDGQRRQQADIWRTVAGWIWVAYVALLSAGVFFLFS